jgi:hypothetical protein
MKTKGGCEEKTKLGFSDRQGALVVTFFFGNEKRESCASETGTGYIKSWDKMDGREFF